MEIFKEITVQMPKNKENQISVKLALDVMTLKITYHAQVPIVTLLFGVSIELTIFSVSH